MLETQTVLVLPVVLVGCSILVDTTDLHRDDEAHRRFGLALSLPKWPPALAYLRPLRPPGWFVQGVRVAYGTSFGFMERHEQFKFHDVGKFCILNFGLLTNRFLTL